MRLIPTLFVLPCFVMAIACDDGAGNVTDGLAWSPRTVAESPALHLPPACDESPECMDPARPFCSNLGRCIPDPDPRRPFLMGFSPWPWDATLEAVDWTYEHLRASGDLISEHLEEGVPWPEALADDAFSESYRDELTFRLQRVGDLATVLQINALNIGRDGLAGYRGDQIAMPLPEPWASARFNDEKVKTAYLNYARRMIEAFSPAYVLIGVEVNLLLRNNPALWPDWVELNSFVYSQLKLEFPDLPVGVSVFCVPYFDQWSGEDDSATQVAALRDDLEPHTDFIAFSLHPFMSALLADSFPDDYLWNLFSLTQKPVAVSESSYPAQQWHLESPALTFAGTPEKQDRFLRLMLETARDFEAAFLIWFTIRDYDQLWEGALGSSVESLIWRDTGLYDEAGVPRRASLRWNTWLDYPWTP